MRRKKKSSRLFRQEDASEGKKESDSEAAKNTRDYQRAMVG